MLECGVALGSTRASGRVAGGVFAGARWLAHSKTFAVAKIKQLFQKTHSKSTRCPPLTDRKKTRCAAGWLWLRWWRTRGAAG